MAGGGSPETKAEDPQPHPPKDQISYGISSSPPLRTMSNDEVEISLPYDSKRMTGFVGLMNNQPGEKPYASALIQMLFHIPSFREAVLDIPENIPIKSLFLRLESSNTTVYETLGMSGNTLKNGLLEILASVNEKMNGTAGEGTIQKLFEGNFDLLKKAEDDSYSSKEPFFCLELDVLACSDVHASFDKMVKEGKLFNTFPPLLFFQLNRLDSHCNQRYIYPYEIDVGKFLANPDGTEQVTYQLKSVIVHGGGSDCDEKYFLITNPTMEEDKWLKIDGYSVIMVDRNRAIEEQYGGEEEVPPWNFTKGTKALMLLYGRETYKESNLRLKKEEGKEVNKVKTTSITIQVINVDEDHGRNKLLSLTVRRVTMFDVFQKTVADFYGVPIHRIRFFTDSDTSPHTLVREKRMVTVAQAVGGSRKLFLRFNRSPGFTGVCELCPIREPRDIEDCY